MFTKIKGILRTMIRDMQRNASIAFSSIAVMTLVFLIFTIFTGIAYITTKLFQYVETLPHLEVFFHTTVPQETIQEIKAVLESTGKCEYVEYTSQEEAAEYMRERYSDQPFILQSITPEVLPASLAIRAKKLDYIVELNSVVEAQDPEDSLIFEIAYNEDRTNLLKDILFWMKVNGSILFTICMVVIFLVSLLTLKLSIKLREHEIEIMHLVGGDRWYIRMPFILQGALFSAIGSLLASLLIIGAGTILYFLKDQSPTLTFLSEFFSGVNIPEISIQLVLLFLLVEVILGAFIGILNTTVAVLHHLE